MEGKILRFQKPEVSASTVAIKREKNVCSRQGKASSRRLTRDCPKRFQLFLGTRIHCKWFKSSRPGPGRLSLPYQKMFLLLGRLPTKNYKRTYKKVPTLLWSPVQTLSTHYFYEERLVLSHTSDSSLPYIQVKNFSRIGKILSRLCRSPSDVKSCRLLTNQRDKLSSREATSHQDKTTARIQRILTTIIAESSMQNVSTAINSLRFCFYGLYLGLK